jgi:hypothetical protein
MSKEKEGDGRYRRGQTTSLQSIAGHTTARNQI